MSRGRIFLLYYEKKGVIYLAHAHDVARFSILPLTTRPSVPSHRPPFPTAALPSSLSATAMRISELTERMQIRTVRNETAQGKEAKLRAQSSIVREPERERERESRAALQREAGAHTQPKSQDRKGNAAVMEVEPPPAATAPAVLKCLGGDQSRFDEAAAGPPQQPPEDGATPATSRRRADEKSRARRKAGGGRATPSPSWKLEASPPPPRAEEAEAAGRKGGASARQLGATVSEVQDAIRVFGRIRRRSRRAPTGDEAGADRVSALW
jgi:hypothetical protein